MLHDVANNSASNWWKEDVHFFIHYSYLMYHVSQLVWSVFRNQVSQHGQSANQNQTFQLVWSIHLYGVFQFVWPASLNQNSESVHSYLEIVHSTISSEPLLFEYSHVKFHSLIFTEDVLSGECLLLWPHIDLAPSSQEEGASLEFIKFSVGDISTTDWAL